MTGQKIENENENENENNLIFIFKIIGGAWRLLLLGSMVVGVSVGALSYFWPKTYESSAVLRLNQEQISLLYTSSVLDPVILKLELQNQYNGDIEITRNDIKKRIRINLDKKNQLVTFVAQAQTAEGAQQLLVNIIDSLLDTLKPNKQENDAMLNTLAINASSIDKFEYLVSSGMQGKANGKTDQYDGLKQSLVTAIREMMALEKESAEIRAKVHYDYSTHIIEPPNRPKKYASPSHIFAAIGAAVVSFIALLVFIVCKTIYKTYNCNSG